MARHLVELLLELFETRLGRQALLLALLELDLELVVLKLSHAVGGAELDEARHGQLDLVEQLEDVKRLLLRCRGGLRTLNNYTH